MESGKQKLYPLEFGSLSLKEDEDFQKWISELKIKLWEEHREEADKAGLDFIAYINKYKFSSHVGHSIEKLCEVWNIQWPLIKVMVESGLIKPQIGIGCKIDIEGNLHRFIRNIKITMEDINKIESMYGDYKNNHLEYNRQKEAEKQHDVFDENRKLKKDLKNAMLKIEELEKYIPISSKTNVDDADEDHSRNNQSKDIKRTVAFVLRCCDTKKQMKRFEHEDLWRELLREEGFVVDDKSILRKRAFEAARVALPADFKMKDPSEK